MDAGDFQWLWTFAFLTALLPWFGIVAREAGLRDAAAPGFPVRAELALLTDLGRRK